MQGKRQIVGEQESVSVLCVLQSCFVRGAAFVLLKMRPPCVGSVLTGTGLAVVTQMKLVLSALQQPGTGK